jgi:uncharacterized protein (DUF1810 family)
VDAPADQLAGVADPSEADEAIVGRIERHRAIWEVGRIGQVSQPPASPSAVAEARPRPYDPTMPYDLERFVEAQADVYERALGELRAGAKIGHWMWFIFPQVAGLGRSDVSRYYAIGSVSEARAYLAHPVLGSRLRESARALLGVEGRSAERILGGIDALKLRSSMTLFRRVDPGEPVFREVLDRYFDGRGDDLTDALIADDTDRGAR